MFTGVFPIMINTTHQWKSWTFPYISSREWRLLDWGSIILLSVVTWKGKRKRNVLLKHAFRNEQPKGNWLGCLIFNLVCGWHLWYPNVYVHKHWKNKFFIGFADVIIPWLFTIAFYTFNPPNGWLIAKTIHSFISSTLSCLVSWWIRRLPQEPWAQ